jgi:WD40 repeat protein
MKHWLRLGSGKPWLHCLLMILAAMTPVTAVQAQTSSGFSPELVWLHSILEPASIAHSGNLLAVPSRQGTVSIYRVSDRTLLRVVPAHNAPVNAVAFSRDGRRLATGSDDRAVKVWEVSADGRNVRLLYTLNEHTSWINALAFSPDGTALASASHDQTIRVWSLSDGTRRLVLTGHTGSVTSVAFSPDGQTVASGSEDRTIQLWDVNTGTVVRTFVGHDFAVRSVAFSPDGTQIASGSDDKTVRLWSVSAGSLLLTFAGHTGSVTSVAFTPDGQRIASGSEDRIIQLWDVNTGTLVRTYAGHDLAVRCVAFSPDGTQIASGSDDKSVRIWLVSTGATVRIFSEHTNDVTATAVAPDNVQVASASKDGTVILRQLTTGVVETTIVPAHNNWVTCLAYSDDGNWVASGGRDQFVRIWNARTGAPVLGPLNHGGWVYAVALSPDGSLLASAGENGVIRLWATSSGAPVAQISADPPVWSLAFSRDNTLLAAALDNGQVRIYRVSNQDEVQRINAHTGRAYAVAFSRAGNVLASTGQDGVIRLWNATDWSRRGELVGHVGPVYSVAFSRDGAFVISGGEDNTVRYWSVETLAPLKVLRGHATAVKSVALSGDGLYAASANEDGLALWRVREAPYNVPPSVPEIIQPENGAVLSPTPTFVLRAEDANGDQVRFVIELVQGDNTLTLQTDLVDSGRRLSVTVPNALTSGEWRYRVRAIDAKGSESSHTSGVVNVADEVISTIPAGLSSWGLGLNIGNKTKADLGLAGIPIRVWDTTAQQYREVGNAEPLVPGRGYWVKPGSVAQLIMSGTPNASPFFIHLKAGWNHIANPFLLPLQWDPAAIRVRRNAEERSLEEASRVGWVAGYAWAWDNSQQRYVLVSDPSYVPGAQTQIAPWQSCWVYAYQDCDLILARSRGTDTAVGRSLQQTPRQWSIRLQVQLGAHWMGVVVGGSRLSQDVAVGLPPDPPVSTPMPKMYLLRQGAPVAADLRADGRMSTAWDIVVEVPEGSAEETATLLWQGAHLAPRGVNPVLVDLQTGERKFLRTTSSHRFAVSRQGGVYRFRVEMLPSAQLLRIAHARVYGGRSSGGRYSIVYELSDTAQVEVSVTSGGRLVRRLAAGVTRAAGLQQVTWDGRDQNGVAVPAGAYMVEIRASNSDGQAVRATVPVVVTR